MIDFRCMLFSISIATLTLPGCTNALRESSVNSRSIDSDDAIEVRKVKGPVELVVRLSPKAPRLSDLVEMEIEVTTAPDVDIKPPTFGQAVGDFLVRNYSEKVDTSVERDPLDPKNDSKTTKKRFRYQLEPVFAGRHLIRSIAIEFVDNRLDSENRGKSVLIESDPIELEITSELGDKVPSLTDLAPMIPPRPLSQTTSWIWLGIPLIAVVFGLISVLLRKQRAPKESKIAIRSPSEIAHAALESLLSENLPQQNRFQEFYLRLTGIVRVYIESSTGVHAAEQTTEEFLQAMRARNLFQADQSVRLKDFLEAADMVKFAGQEPASDQLDLSIRRAREFIDLRTQHSLAVDTRGGS